MEGIANGGDLDGGYLDGIYDRIKTSAISLKEDDQLRKQAKDSSSGRDGHHGFADLINPLGAQVVTTRDGWHEGILRQAIRPDGPRAGADLNSLTTALLATGPG